MKKILAVSGGIDSMVMLDFLCRSHPDVDWQVVSIDHGTRPSSATDADFVAKIAREKYHLNTKIVGLKLGENASEADARAARYAALFSIADESAEIYLAHHLDDLVESVAINLIRGTGWRGLAVMDHKPKLIRPLLDIEADKTWVYHYAARHNIVFREDPTNASDAYLRNRLRPQVRTLPREVKSELYKLWREQLKLKSEIDSRTQEILGAQPQGHLERSFIKSLIETAPAAADEILRAWLLAGGISTTHPERERLAKALQTYQNGKYFNLSSDKLLKISKSLEY